jgi:oxygen-dependent protoporphyrinogen oxidase
VRTGAPVRSIERRGAGYLVRIEGSEDVEADRLLVTVPAGAAAAVLRDVNPRASELAATVPYVSTAVVAFGFRRADVRHPLAGHGYVVGLGERMRHTAVTWVSSKWPGRAPDGHVLLRCFTGRAGDQAALALDDAALARALLAELGPLLGVTGAPVLTRVYRWEASMPQYTMGHLERVAALRRALGATPGIVVAGGGYDGVGIPDCIRQGREAAAQALPMAARAP